MVGDAAFSNPCPPAWAVRALAWKPGVGWRRRPTQSARNCRRGYSSNAMPVFEKWQQISGCRTAMCTTTSETQRGRIAKRGVA